jgi:hypothetical protein
VVVSGTGLGLPGANKPVMDPDNALRILRGEQFIDLIPERFRQQNGWASASPGWSRRRRQRQLPGDHRPG